MHIEKKNSTNPHITDTIVVSDFRNVNVAGSDLIGLMNQKKKIIQQFSWHSVLNS